MALVGSVAGDEARPDSDIDFLVVFEGPTTFERHMGLLVYLEDLPGRRVDVVAVAGLKPRLRPLIEQDLFASRDALPLVAVIVAAGEATFRFTDGVTFEVFAANDEKRAASETCSPTATG